LNDKLQDEYVGGDPVRTHDDYVQEDAAAARSVIAEIRQQAAAFTPDENNPVFAKQLNDRRQLCGRYGWTKTS
jgi:hypothetical protein